jgi:hypothetical protein
MHGRHGAYRYPSRSRRARLTLPTCPPGQLRPIPSHPIPSHLLGQHCSAPSTIPPSTEHPARLPCSCSEGKCSRSVRPDRIEPPGIYSRHGSLSQSHPTKSHVRFLAALHRLTHYPRRLPAKLFGTMNHLKEAEKNATKLVQDARKGIIAPCQYGVNVYTCVYLPSFLRSHLHRRVMSSAATLDAP